MPRIFRIIKRCIVVFRQVTPIFGMPKSGKMACFALEMPFGVWFWFIEFVGRFNKSKPDPALSTPLSPDPALSRTFSILLDPDSSPAAQVS